MSIIQLSKAQAARKAALRPSGYVCGQCGEEHCECAQVRTASRPQQQSKAPHGAGVFVIVPATALALVALWHLFAWWFQ